MVLAWLMMRWLISFPITPLVSFSWVEGQPSTSAQNPVPQAIYSRQPIYRPEWVKQSLTGRGIVLITIDPKTGIVTAARMHQSTGSELLDRAALKAYAKWRFKPGSMAQVKMPIEFASRPRPQPSNEVQRQPAILYVLLILLGFGAAVIGMRKRKTST